MSSPILHGTALCPLFRFPTGARLRLKVAMDADFSLTDREIRFACRPRYKVGDARPLYLAPDSVPLNLTSDPFCVRVARDMVPDPS